MECLKVSQGFKIVGVKGSGAYANFNTQIPKAAQQILKRASEIENSSGTEIAIFEPKKDENHLEGSYYVGMIVNQAPTELPMGMDYIELDYDYVTTKGNINDIGNLHNKLLKWAHDKGYKRNLEQYNVETYHPLENGEEEVGIYLPVHP